MIAKYRVRLSNERIVGPFSLEEIGELFKKEHIVGTEMCQQFPIGDWRPIPAFKEITALIDQLKKENIQSPQAPLKQEESTTAKNEKSETFNEFKFGKDVSIDIDYAALEKQYKKSQDPQASTDSESDVDKTVIKKTTKAPVDLDKTVIRKIDHKAEFKKEATKTTSATNTEGLDDIENILAINKQIEKENNHIVKLNLNDDVSEDSESEEGDQNKKKALTTDKTEFLSLTRILPSLNAELSVAEVELSQKVELDQQKEEKRLKEIREIIITEQAIEEGIDEEDIEIVEEVSEDETDTVPVVKIKSKKKKGMSVVALLAFIGVFYYMFMMDEDKPVVDNSPRYIEVKFPIVAAQENIENANKNLVEARKYYLNGTYNSRAISTGFYLLSLQNKFKGNEALSEIILTYAELLDNTADKYAAANTLFKYVQVTESKVLVDHNVATGVALFYSKIKKYQTGIYTIKNYLRAGNKPTPKMLAYYLNLLVNAGELVEARSVYDSLSKIPKKPLEAYQEMANFQFMDENLSGARNVLDEGLKYYPNSVLLLLTYSDILIKEQSIKKLEETLKKIESLGAERSPVYLAKFYKHMGYAAAFNNKNELAAQFFKKSLSLQESDELRSTLASLDIAGTKISQNLILESKVIELVKKAKEQYRLKNIESAFQYIIEAVDANPDNIEAVLFHAELNMYRGLFQSAIYSLQRILSLHPKNNHIKTVLLEAYIRSYRLNDAETLLSEMGQTTFNATPTFAEMMGLYSEARGIKNMALRWYDRALKRDPLDDKVMYRISKILVKSNKFQESRGMLGKAIILDPKNPEYHALYSEILYEQDGADTAIGYIRDTMGELGEDPVLLSAITAFYFKSGQLKEFQNYYDKVNRMPKNSDALYEVLIHAAELEGRKDEYITHSKALIKLNPGNLKARMNLGILYYEEGRYDEAINELGEVKDMLESYPNVNFHLAKVYIAKNDIENAEVMAKKELELNPNLDTSHFIMGEVLRLQGDYRDAILKYEKAISLNPRSVDAIVAMSEIRIRQNYANEAIDLLNRAIKEDINNPKIHKLLGDAYRSAGQRALAREKYEDYLKLAPTASDKQLIESLIRNLK